MEDFHFQKFLCQRILSASQEEFKAAHSARARNNTVLLVSKNTQVCCDAAASILRRELGRRAQIPRIFSPATIAVAKDIIDGRKDGLAVLQVELPLVLEEYPIQIPFVSKPDSFLLDSLHMAFGIMTALIDQRNQHGNLTLILTPPGFRYSATTNSFPAYFTHASNSKPAIHNIIDEPAKKPKAA